MDVSLLSHISTELDSDVTICIYAYNLKGGRGFDIVFPLDGVVILQDSLSNVVIMLCTPLIAFNRTLFTSASLLQVILCLRRMVSSMSWKNIRRSELAFSIMEIVDLIMYIVVTSLSSTR